VSGSIRILAIELDGHFHGSSDVPKPWVAEIQGLDPKFGLRREFVQSLNDWSEARRAWRGNVYGRVARFPLRDGRLYEVSRLRGRSSKRHVAREFVAIDGRKQVAIEPEKALARVDGGAPSAGFRIPEDRDGSSWVARITGLGTPERLGFVVVETERLYRLRDGLYEVVEGESRRLVGVRAQAVQRLTEREAFAWLAA
jgi:hypothetical protein